MKQLSCLLLSCILYGFSSAFAAPPPDQGYTLVWSDEFDGTVPNPENWGFQDTGCLGAGMGGEYYSQNNATIVNGALVLEARLETTAGPWQKCSHPITSARMDTQGKKSFTYGYFEVKLKAPHGNGLWPAFWTLGESIKTIAWPTCGELELYEQRTGTWPVAGTVGDNVFIGTCHFMGAAGVSYNSKQYVSTDCLCNDYHLYAVLWDSTFMEYYFDDQVYWPRTQTPDILQSYNYAAFHNPHFLIANLAVGGSYVFSVTSIDNSIFPQRMYIDYVRVYQKVAVHAKENMQKNALSSLSRIDPTKAQLKIYDLQGRFVGDYTDKIRGMTYGERIVKSTLSDLPIGIYIARFSGGSTTISEKLVVTK
jgi:beta-glucanase (GH16 family)